MSFSPAPILKQANRQNNMLRTETWTSHQSQHHRQADPWSPLAGQASSTGDSWSSEKPWLLRNLPRGVHTQIKRANASEPLKYYSSLKAKRTKSKWWFLFLHSELISIKQNFKIKLYIYFAWLKLIYIYIYKIGIQVNRMKQIKYLYIQKGTHVHNRNKMSKKDSWQWRCSSFGQVFVLVSIPRTK